jgi:stage V sporulation protein AE
LKRKVILVTDGDDIAKKALKVAAHNIGGHIISKSGGNPTNLSAVQVLREIKKATSDPVIVMVDDSGEPGIGPGEELIRKIVEHPDIDVLGVIAVASNTEADDSVEVMKSITRDGNVIQGAVDKYGTPKSGRTVTGDTLSILKELKVPIIIGLGDPGKMGYKDDPAKGAPITTKALKEIMERSGSTETRN